MVAIAPKDISVLTCKPCSILPLAVTLPDGSVVLLRSVVPEDSERLRAMFYRLSPETRYRWFFVGAPSLPHWAERVAALASVNGYSTYAVVALAGDDLVGIARYDVTTEENQETHNAIEVGMLIEDGWQSRRLGTHLARALLLEAQQRGMTACVARVLGDNHRAIKLAVKNLPGALTSWGGGEVQFQAQLSTYLGET